MSLPHAPRPPKSLEEWFWYVRRYEKGIFVREPGADGKMRPVSLADLPPDRWAHYIVKWVREGHDPVRVLEQDEIGAKAERVSPSLLLSNPRASEGSNMNGANFFLGLILGVLTFIASTLLVIELKLLPLINHLMQK